MLFTPRVTKASLIFMLVLAIGLMSLTTGRLEGTEFSGGWLTGRLLNIAEAGIVMFVLALFLTNWSSKAAACVALTASVCCLPLLVYFIAPGPFRSAFKGEYSVPLESAFEWTW